VFEVFDLADEVIVKIQLEKIATVVKTFDLFNLVKR
jgi:hypothetical protein